MDNSIIPFHSSLDGKDVGHEGASIVVHRMLKDITAKEKEYCPQDSRWEMDMVSSLRLCKGVEEGSKIAQVYVLMLLKRHWNDLSFEFRKSYDFQFNVLVMRETNILPDTMENYIRAAETFIEKGVRPEGQVEVIRYDSYGNPVKQNGEVVKDRVDFDLSKASISKLVLARPLAEQGKMTAELWSKLADPKVTTDAFRTEIYRPVVEANTVRVDPSLRFELEGNIIVAYEFGIRAEIAEIFWEVGDTDAGMSGIRRLLQVLGIKSDENVIATRIQEARNRQLIRVYNNGGSALLPEE